MPIHFCIWDKILKSAPVCFFKCCITDTDRLKINLFKINKKILNLFYMFINFKSIKCSQKNLHFFNFCHDKSPNNIHVILLMVIVRNSNLVKFDKIDQGRDVCTFLLSRSNSVFFTNFDFVYIGTFFTFLLYEVSDLLSDILKEIEKLRLAI